MNRRTSLKLLALAPLPMAAGFSCNDVDVQQAQQKAAAARASGDFTPGFFTEHEYQTVGVLADLILPADDRSPSASALGVPAFMDFMMRDRPKMQVPMRGGLAWLDAHTHRRFGHSFIACTDAERRSVLEKIAYPEQAAPELSHGVAFFNSFRDLTASGFWTTKEGMADLQYLGNTASGTWDGAPQAEMDRLGLRLDDWIAK